MALDQARLNELSDSYVEHVRLILRANDGGANLRDFLDPWWSFRKGEPFVRLTRKGHYKQHTLDNPCPWEHRNRLGKLDWISQGAEAALARCIRKKGRADDDLENALIVDHAVPFAVIGRHLFEKRLEWTAESLTAFLQHHYRRGLLTRAENNLLNAKRDGLSLQAEMPHGWQPGNDPFARYRDRSIAQAKLALAA